MDKLTIILCVASATVLLLSFIAARERAKEKYLREFRYPPGLFEKLRKRRPDLTLKDCQLVGTALRQFFLVYKMGKYKFVSMPTQVTDDLWHEFILYTREYKEFCNKGFGSFLHHTPAVVLGKEQKDNAGLRRAWWYSCKEEHIDPNKPTRLPLLFAIDTKLNIADGFRYAPDCEALRKQGINDVNCGASISGSGCGGGPGCGGSASDGGTGDGSCGGGGCGGGGD